MTVIGEDVVTLPLVDLERALSMAAALRSAVELGVLDRLERGPANTTALAEDCKLTPRGAELLLKTLAALGLLETDDRTHFSPGVASLAGVRELVTGWADLSRVLRGERTRATADTREGSEALYPRILPTLAAMFEGAAESAAGILAGPGLHVLDIGAGAAPWSIALARRGRGTRVTAIDLPAVLPVTRRAVEAAGLEEVYEFLPGDALSADWGLKRYDLVVVGNLCHLFGEESNRRLLARARTAMRQQGTLAIIDILPDETLDGRPAIALYTLGLLLRTESGRPYPYSAYARWLEEAGFMSIERRELAASPPLSLITARENS